MQNRKSEYISRTLHDKLVLQQFRCEILKSLKSKPSSFLDIYIIICSLAKTT